MPKSQEPSASPPRGWYRGPHKFQAGVGRNIDMNHTEQYFCVSHPISIPNRPQIPGKSHGHMASSRFGKNLVCFYCNSKSAIKYNGLLDRWDCTKCDATNFLDEVCLSWNRPDPYTYIELERWDYRPSCRDSGRDICFERTLHYSSIRFTSLLQRVRGGTLLLNMSEKPAPLYYIDRSVWCGLGHCRSQLQDLWEGILQVEERPGEEISPSLRRLWTKSTEAYARSRPDREIWLLGQAVEQISGQEV